jgi:toxin secretion/phage lysis holin
MTIKTTLCSVIGAVGAAISGLFGGWNAALTTLVIFMGIDYITGIIVAGVFHKSQKSENGGLQSIIGWKGLCRKGVTLAIVLVAYRLDLLIGTNYVRDAVTIAFCANEIISITENAALMGVPLPEPIVQAIEVLTHQRDVR